MLSNYFREVTRGPWITAGKNVQYKVIDRVLYFECSDGKSDWRYNLAFGETVYDDGEFRAHRGFKMLWKSVKKEIEALDFDTIVGYSQGAALALFAHENFLHRKGYEPISFVFGCPRVLYRPSKKILARFSQFYRFENPGDMVTMVPPSIIGYKHAGKETVLKQEATRPKGCNLFRWASGHSPEEYRQRLSGA